VIVCNVTAASAAKAVTSTVPIVFATGDDPIGEGLVTSLNQPGGNVTGVSFLGNALGAKQVELLHELVPKATTIAILVDTNYQGSVSGLTDVEAAAHSLGQQLIVLHASSERDLDAASATLAQQRADALIVLGAAFFLSRRDQIIALAAQQASCHLPGAGLRRRRRADELRRQHQRCVSPGWGLHGKNPPRREACQLAGPTVYETRADHQSQDREEARPDRSADAASGRPRGH
jgi:hypothetical protein